MLLSSHSWRVTLKLCCTSLVIASGIAVILWIIKLFSSSVVCCLHLKTLTFGCYLCERVIHGISLYREMRCPGKISLRTSIDALVVYAMDLCMMFTIVCQDGNWNGMAAAATAPTTQHCYLYLHDSNFRS